MDYRSHGTIFSRKLVISFCTSHQPFLEELPLVTNRFAFPFRVPIKKGLEIILVWFDITRYFAIIVNILPLGVPSLKIEK